eukprot:1286683-Pleurochrysis_carterae.AAC.1
MSRRAKAAARRRQCRHQTTGGRSRAFDPCDAAAAARSARPTATSSARSRCLPAASPPSSSCAWATRVRRGRERAA